MKNIYLLSNQTKTSVSRRLDAISLPSRCRVMPIILLFLTAFSLHAWGVDYTYSFTINTSDFNTTSYAANNNEKTSTATCTTDGSKTMSVKWTSYQVMKSSGNMQ